MNPVVTYIVQLKRKVFDWYFTKRLRALPSNRLAYELQINPITFLGIKKGLRDYLILERTSCQRLGRAISSCFVKVDGWVILMRSAMSK